jgi:hypothetical protein
MLSGSKSSRACVWCRGYSCHCCWAWGHVRCGRDRGSRYTPDYAWYYACVCMYPLMSTCMNTLLRHWWTYPRMLRVCICHISSASLHMCVCVNVHIRVCVCVCVYIYIYIYIYIYMDTLCWDRCLFVDTYMHANSCIHMYMYVVIHMIHVHIYTHDHSNTPYRFFGPCLY